jgi:hypothetical protein
VSCDGAPSVLGDEVAVDGRGGVRSRYHAPLLAAAAFAGTGLVTGGTVMTMGRAKG